MLTGDQVLVVSVLPVRDGNGLAGVPVARIVDVVGAGDGFAAGVLAGRLQGGDYAQSPGWQRRSQWPIWATLRGIPPVARLKLGCNPGGRTGRGETGPNDFP